MSFSRSFPGRRICIVKDNVDPSQQTLSAMRKHGATNSRYFAKFSELVDSSLALLALRIHVGLKSRASSSLPSMRNSLSYGFQRHTHFWSSFLGACVLTPGRDRVANGSTSALKWAKQKRPLRAVGCDTPMRDFVWKMSDPFLLSAYFGLVPCFGGCTSNCSMTASNSAIGSLCVL